MKLYEVTIVPCSLYGSETWLLNGTTCIRAQSAEVKFLLSVLVVTRRVRDQREAIRER